MLSAPCERHTVLLAPCAHTVPYEHSTVYHLQGTKHTVQQLSKSHLRDILLLILVVNIVLNELGRAHGHLHAPIEVGVDSLKGDSNGDLA